MDTVNDGGMEALARALSPSAPADSLAETEEYREHTASIRVRGLVVLQTVARGYSIGYASRVRGEPLEELIVCVRETLDVLGSYTITDGVREARRRGLID